MAASFATSSPVTVVRVSRPMLANTHRSPIVDPSTPARIVPSGIVPQATSR